MTKTNFEHGTQITPEFLNALNNPTYSVNPQEDGQIPYPDKAGLGLDIVEQNIAQLVDAIASESEARTAGDAAEASARHAADLAFDVRVTALESALTQVRIPDTGANALKVYGATANASSADVDITFGALYQVATKGSAGVLSLFASFALVTGNLVSSSREVSFHLSDSVFGALALSTLSPKESPIPLPRHIPVQVRLGSTGTKTYWLRVYPFGDTTFLQLCDEAAVPLTYAGLLTAAGISAVIQFDINFNTPLMPAV